MDENVIAATSTCMMRRIGKKERHTSSPTGRNSFIHIFWTPMQPKRHYLRDHTMKEEEERKASQQLHQRRGCWREEALWWREQWENVTDKMEEPFLVLFFHFIHQVVEEEEQQIKDREKMWKERDRKEQFVFIAMM